MFGSQIFDMALGLSFIYLVLSLILTSAQELIETKVKMRATTLEQGIRQILSDPTGDQLAKSFYDHPLIDALSPGQYVGPRTPPANLPSYIPAESFSRALLGLEAAGKVPADGPVALLLAELRKSIGPEADALRKAVERWFNSAMDRVAGIYKRKTQWRVLIGAAVLTIALNVDSLAVIQSLLQDPALRTAVAAEAQAQASPPTAQSPGQVRARVAEIQSLGLPIGWEAAQRERMAAALGAPGGSAAVGALMIALGWLLTIVAISLGAPFWFDALNRIMVLRSTVKPTEKSPPESSKDPQS